MNDLEKVIPQLLAQGLMALRSACVMPGLVNRDYEAMAAQKGAVITIPIPSAIDAQDVEPGITAQSTPSLGPTSAEIPLDQWKEAPFTLTDRNMMEAMEGTIPMQASEAISSLATTVNGHILSQYKGVYGFHGEPGTTPFGSGTGSATGVRKVLNNQLAPVDNNRWMVLDPDAEANALDLRAFQDMSWVGSAEAIREGNIDRRLGFGFAMDQQIPVHTAGTISGDVTVDANTEAGSNVVVLATEAGASVDLVEGDIIEFAGHTQTYVVTSDLSIGSDSTGEVSIAPVVQVDLVAEEAVSVKADHAVNLAFHRDAFAFASRPLADQTQGLGNIIQSATDPVSGLSLRLEVSRQHKQTRFSYDILFGSALIRRELAARLAG